MALYGKQHLVSFAQELHVMRPSQAPHWLLPEDAAPYFRLEPGVPVLALVAYGAQHQYRETSHFYRSMWAHRSPSSPPLRVVVLGDADGLRAVVDVVQSSVGVTGLREAGVTMSLVNMDCMVQWRAIEMAIHPNTKLRHPRLFIKLFTHDLFPHLSKVLLLDNDLVIFADLAELWLEFDDFSEHQLVSMSVDQR